MGEFATFLKDWDTKLRQDFIQRWSSRKTLSLSMLALIEVAARVKTFNSIDKLHLPNALKAELKKIRKDIEIQFDPNRDIYNFRMEISDKSENYINVKLLHVKITSFKYYDLDEPERCSCMVSSDCPYVKYPPSYDRELNNLCKMCASQLAIKNPSILFFELGVWQDHDLRYNAGKKVVETFSDYSELAFFLFKYKDNYKNCYCDFCMSPLFEITIEICPGTYCAEEVFPGLTFCQVHKLLGKFPPLLISSDEEE